MKTPARRIYLDYATTTPLDGRVERAMHPFWSARFGNPGSIHADGVAAGKAVSDARRAVARCLEARPHEIIFTASGTEANNLALQGTVRHLQNSGVPLSKQHVVTTVIEHSSVLETLRSLEREGLPVTHVPVTRDGILNLAELKRALTPETVLVSVMLANNEIGTVQPVRKISALLRESKLSYIHSPKPLLHTDACQAPLYLDVNQNRLGVDLMSLDGHKLYGPKGIGMLYVRDGAKLAPIAYGGGQERGLRPGTESVPLIVGFSAALQLAHTRREKDAAHLQVLRDRFLRRLSLLKIPATVNGSMSDRLPNNINISVAGIDAEFAVLQLDAQGVSVSAKSACLEGEKESYVVKALGRGDGSERNALRFTLGRATTTAEIDRAVAVLARVVAGNGNRGKRTRRLH